MNPLLILLAIGAVILAVGVTIKILVGLGRGIRGGLVELVYWIGRAKASRYVVFVPEELQPGGTPFPRNDVDVEALKRYRPIPENTVPAEWVELTNELGNLFAEQAEMPHRIEISRVIEILRMPATPAYQKLLEILEGRPDYPSPPPDRPASLKAPPPWTPWPESLPSPTLRLPYYGPTFSFLNAFVAVAHRDESAQYSAALARRAELEDAAVARNERIRALAEDANRRFESAHSLQEKSYSAALTQHLRASKKYDDARNSERQRLRELRQQSARTGANGLLSRIDLALRAVSLSLPESFSREFQTKFDSESGILIHEQRFPDVASLEFLKPVHLKSGTTLKPLNQRERYEVAISVYPSICLRIAAEIARLDIGALIKAVAINGWTEYTDRATGQQKRAYCASLFAEKDRILSLKLDAVEPLQAFYALKGIAARSLEVTPIAPVLRLNKEDSRFVDAKEVLSKMAEGENLAAMLWEDFEHLCRELFERAFAGSGAEVKVTQASRDKGVDAVIFDPDPLRGGKIVVQAKRYTNVVDVAAVRELYGAVINEGAIKGILVTTSHYGADAYSFAKDKPITLLDGGELLGLLEQHGYKFRIDLEEARRLAT